MKILIISNTIYPHNQPRAFRATELAKRLANIGHEVHLYGVLGKYNYKNFEEQYGIKIGNLGPMKFYPHNSDNTTTHYSLCRKITGKIFGRILLFPQIEFIIKMGKVLREQKNVDLLITLAPSHALHWSTALVRRKTNEFPSVWIADCGDPFMGTNKFPFYFKYLEDFTFQLADWITIPIENARKAYNKNFHHKIEVIPQGFDFNEVKINEVQPQNQITTFIYAGVFYKDIRNPIHFIKYLTKMNHKFKFRIFTRMNSLVEQYKRLLGDRLEINPIIPRAELLYEMSKADFLVNFNNKEGIQSPSKLIDYAIAKRPILNIEHDKIDIETIHEFLNGNYENQHIVKNIEQYYIENVAQKFLCLYDQKILSNSRSVQNK